MLLCGHWLQDPAPVEAEAFTLALGSLCQLSLVEEGKASEEIPNSGLVGQNLWPSGA